MISLRERPWYQDTLGLAYVPFTFPTATIYGKMVYYKAPITKFSQVDHLWATYISAVKAGWLTRTKKPVNDTYIVQYMTNAIKADYGATNAAIVARAFLQSITDAGIDPAGYLGIVEGITKLIKDTGTAAQTVTKATVKAISAPVTGAVEGASEAAKDTADASGIVKWFKWGGITLAVVTVGLLTTIMVVKPGRNVKIL